MPGKFVAEADIAVGTFAKVEAVDPDVAVSHHAVEFDENMAPSVVCWQVEMFAVPTDTAWQIAASATRWAVLVIRTFNAPIMGHVKPAPRGIIKFRLLGTRRIGLEKTPIKVEGCGDSSRWVGLVAAPVVTGSNKHYNDCKNEWHNLRLHRIDIAHINSPFR